MRAPGALQYDDIRFQAPHASFVDQLVPVCAALLDAATQAGEVIADIDASTRLRGIGNLCDGAKQDPRCDAHNVVRLLLAGLQQPHLDGGHTSRPRRPRSPHQA